LGDAISGYPTKLYEIALQLQFCPAAIQNLAVHKSATVILSGASAKQREAEAESKDPCTVQI
jgi:hypothetical protein